MAIRLTHAARIPVTSLIGGMPRRGEDVEQLICAIEEQNALEAGRYARSFSFDRASGLVTFYGEIEEDEENYHEDLRIEQEILDYFDPEEGEWLPVVMTLPPVTRYRYYGDMETCGGSLLPIGATKVA